jgi:hypothetical protein
MSSEGLKFEFPFKTCFVITPYGRRDEPDDASKKEPRRSYDFELIYDEIIAKALHGIVPITHRSKDRIFSGIIHEDMFREIISADVVVCDITLLNPNVMYELGVRHAARPSGTIIIRQDNRPLPFNLALARVVTYVPPPETEPASPGREAAPPLAESEKANREKLLAEARDQLRSYVRQSLSTRKIDSPVHALIPNLNLIAPPRQLKTIATGVFDLDPEVSQKIAEAMRKAAEDEAATRKNADSGNSEPQSLGDSLQKASMTTSSEVPAYRSEMAPRSAGPEIGIATGNMRDIYDAADVWVNPENTRMEMGPLFGETVSSYIRVLGAKSSDKITLGKDKIQAALRSSMRNASYVLPGMTITTGSGSLKDTHGVRRIVHVAAQEGFPLGGFSTVKSIETCVESALEEIERQNNRLVCRLGLVASLRRVLIPLFGTRNPNRSPVDIATDIVRAAKRHLDLETGTTIRRVLFLATTDQDLELCETAFRRLGYAVEAIDWRVHSDGGR